MDELGGRVFPWPLEETGMFLCLPFLGKLRVDYVGVLMPVVDANPHLKFERLSVFLYYSLSRPLQ